MAPECHWRCLGIYQLRLGTRIARFDHRPDAAPGTEITFNDCPNGFRGAHYIFQYLVYDVLLKDAEVAIGEEVFLQGLQFEALPIGHVADGERAEIWQASLGTDGGEFRDIDHDLVSGKLIWPGLDRGKVRVQTGFGMRLGVSLGHVDILNGEQVRPLLAPEWKVFPYG